MRAIVVRLNSDVWPVWRQALGSKARQVPRDASDVVHDTDRLIVVSDKLPGWTSVVMWQEPHFCAPPEAAEMLRDCLGVEVGT